MRPDGADTDVMFNPNIFQNLFSWGNSINPRRALFFNVGNDDSFFSFIERVKRMPTNAPDSCLFTKNVPTKRFEYKLISRHGRVFTDNNGNYK